MRYSVRSLLLSAAIVMATACDFLTGPDEPFTGLWEGSNEHAELTLNIRQYGDSLAGMATFVRPGMSDGPRPFVGRAYGDSIALRWPMPPLTGYSSGNFHGHRVFMALDGVFQGDSITLMKR
jgi:hypothetical protein